MFNVIEIALEETTSGKGGVRLGGEENLLAEIAEIKKAPFTRSFRYDEVRFAVVRKFPYAAHYTFEKDNRILKIQAVLGFAQDSATNWKMRF